MRTPIYLLIILIALLLAGFIGMLTYYSFTPLRQNSVEQNPDKQAFAPNQSLPTRPVITSTDPIRGNLNAPITIVEFGDFFCAACADIQPMLKTILEEQRDNIKLVWKDFPNIQRHILAQEAAEAARCAQEQGKFWEYHDRLFESQGQSLSEQGLSLIAENLNLDLNNFSQCLNSDRTAGLVTRTLNEGLLLGVDATPYFFINDQRISGAVSKADLEELIKQKLR